MGGHLVPRNLRCILEHVICKSYTLEFRTPIPPHFMLLNPEERFQVCTQTYHCFQGKWRHWAHFSSENSTSSCGSKPFARNLPGQRLPNFYLGIFCPSWAIVMPTCTFLSFLLLSMLSVFLMWTYTITNCLPSLLACPLHHGSGTE